MRAGGKGGIASLLHIVNSWSALPQHKRFAGAKGMRLSRQALVLAGLVVGCSDKQSTVTYDPQTARAKVVGVLPSGWAAMDANWQQQSDTASFFNNPRTEAFMLIGPQSRHGYSESRGQQQREDIYKEC